MAARRGSPSFVSKNRAAPRRFIVLRSDGFLQRYWWNCRSRECAETRSTPCQLAQYNVHTSAPDAGKRGSRFGVRRLHVELYSLLLSCQPSAFGKVIPLLLARWGLISGVRVQFRQNISERSLQTSQRLGTRACECCKWNPFPYA